MTFKIGDRATYRDHNTQEPVIIVHHYTVVGGYQVKSEYDGRYFLADSANLTPAAQASPLAALKVGDKVRHIYTLEDGVVDHIYGPNAVAVMWDNKKQTFVAETDLKVLDQDAEDYSYYLPSGSKKADGCECGAHKVFGFENCHSFWCPAYKG